MSIAGGLFNANHKKDEVGDTKSTADDDATATEAPAADLTTSIPGFDNAEEGLLIETAGEFEDAGGDDVSWAANEDVESVAGGPSGGDFDYDVDAPEEIPLDPES
ncbi:hypothetical protein MWU75_01700 [Ornithinimicrobium sp. F0845]|uniref:hypothetical protein n=1 Tax=Ornithinimicrobium sp. F0845 TaxID=2926412 RepID=UPI001FF328D0|nr:hypothetical protein [Ornithinimicrobium sp. F0845]MCK0110857.1 hypothetical protein [Ornithinimicrobium sp. F0845]